MSVTNQSVHAERAEPKAAGPERSTARRYLPRRAAVLPVVAVVVMVAVWELVVKLFHVSQLTLPAPIDVIRRMVSAHSQLITNSWPTLWAIVDGFLLAVGVGLVLAICIAYSKILRELLYPLLVASQVIPKIAIAPVFVIWLGVGSGPKVLMAFLISFFPIAIDAIAGFAAVRPASVQLLKSMGANPIQEFWRLRLPQALPQIFAGLKVGITFAVVGEVVGEFVGSQNGLGYVLVTAQGTLNSVLVFAAIGYLVIIGAILYIIIEVAEKLLVGRRMSSGAQPGRRRPAGDARRQPAPIPGAQSLTRPEE